MSFLELRYPFIVGEDGLLREVLKSNYYLGLISLLILIVSISSYNIF